MICIHSESAICCIQPSAAEFRIVADKPITSLFLQTAA